MMERIHSRVHCCGYLRSQVTCIHVLGNDLMVLYSIIPHVRAFSLGPFSFFGWHDEL